MKRLSYWEMAAHKPFFIGGILHPVWWFKYGSYREKTWLHTNNKGVDQHAVADQRLFISSMQSLISKLASCKISILWLVAVAEHAALGFTWSRALKTGVLALESVYYWGPEAARFLYLKAASTQCSVEVHHGLHYLNNLPARDVARKGC